MKNPKPFDNMKLTDDAFPGNDWPNNTPGVPGARNLPSMPAAPLSIPIQDPNQVTTTVPYSGTAAMGAIDGADIQPLAGMGSFGQVGSSNRGMTDPFESKKHEPFKW